VCVTLTVPDEELHDWPSQATAIHRGVPVHVALAGCAWFELACSVFGDEVAFFAFDVSGEVRPHMHGTVVTDTTKEAVQQLWPWHSYVRYAFNPRGWLRYCLKGRDGKYAMPAWLPRRITSKRAQHWIVSAAGVGMEHLVRRATLTQKQQLAQRCSGCGKELHALDHISYEQWGSKAPPCWRDQHRKLQLRRRHRRYCSPACRQWSSRVEAEIDEELEHMSDLVAMAGVLRREREQDVVIDPGV
jgi:hypothetical protein